MIDQAPNQNNIAPQPVKRKNHDGLFIFVCILMFFVSFTPFFSMYIGQPLQTVFHDNPAQRQADLEMRSAKARELAAKDPNSLGQPLSKYGMNYTVRNSPFDSIIIAFPSQITVLLLIIIFSIGRFVMHSKRKNEVPQITEVVKSSPNHWHIYIPFFQIAILAVGFFFAFIFGFGFDSAPKTAYLVGPIFGIALIFIWILSLFPLRYLLKKEFNLKNFVICVVGISIPVFISIVFGQAIMQTSEESFVQIKENYEENYESSVKRKSANEFNQSQIENITQKFSKPAIVKSFGETSGIKEVYALFFIETNDGSIIVPLPQSGRATEDGALNNLKDLVGKEINIKLVDDPITLYSIGNPIQKNTSSFTKSEYLFTTYQSFTPSEFYFVNISYNGKAVNLLDPNLTFK